MTETEIKIKLKISTEDWDEKQSKFLDFYAENGYNLSSKYFPQFYGEYLNIQGVPYHIRLSPSFNAKINP